MPRKKSTSTAKLLKETKEVTKPTIKTNVGILTQSQLKTFEIYHSALNNAYNFDVIGRTEKISELELSSIYFEVTGFQLLNWNCNNCRLSNWKKLGKLYFDSLKYYAKQNEET